MVGRSLVEYCEDLMWYRWVQLLTDVFAHTLVQKKWLFTFYGVRSQLEVIEWSIILLHIWCVTLSCSLGWVLLFRLPMGKTHYAINFCDIHSSWRGLGSWTWSKQHDEVIPHTVTDQFSLHTLLLFLVHRSQVHLAFSENIWSDYNTFFLVTMKTSLVGMFTGSGFQSNEGVWTVGEGWKIWRSRN